MPDEVDYFIGLETVTHIGNEKLRRVRVSYYQWAPLILLVQGLCFYIPFLIWNSCANNAGVKLRRLLKKASDIASLPPGCQQREALLAEFVDQFHTLVTGEAGWCADLQCGLGGGGGASGGGLAGGAGGSSSLSGSSNSSSGSSGVGGPAANGPAGRPPRPGAAPNHDSGADGHGGGRRGQSDRNNSDRQRGGGGGQDDGQQQAGCCLVGIPIIGSLLSCCLKPCSSFALVGPSKYLCLLYLAVKTAYVLNVVLQFFLLGQFLGRGYLKHGLELINRLIVNGDWWASPRFPLSTLCQVRADMSGGLRSYTCQCVLPINVFNEKIFSVVWFYMAFLMPLNVLSLLFWIYRTFETNRLSYIRLCLWRTRLVELNQIHRTVRRLSQSYLGWDGVFLLRLIEHNHGSIMATLIMSRLWEFYANQMKLQEDANQLALANNAHQTLAQTNTLLSHHQQQQQHQHPAQQHQHSHHGPPGGGPGANQQHGHQHPQLLGGAAGHAPLAGHHHGAGGHHHGGGGGGGHHGGAHSHALPPLMPSQPQQQQQAQHFGPGGHAHAPGAQHTSFTGGGGGPAHGPHGHHSGQISQPGHHPPLHAANTHVAAGHTRHHLAGAFPAGTVSAGLLAQLQHQQQQQHHHPAAPQPNQAAPGLGNNQAPQQPVLGNVKAVAAALAGAAAAATHSTANPASSSGQAGSTSQQQQSSTSTSNNNSSNSNIGGSGTQSQPSAAANHHLGQSSGGVGAGIHLHSLLQSGVAAGGSGGGPASAPNQQQQQQQQGPQATQLAAVQQQLTSLAAASPAAGASGQPAGATSSHPAANVAAQQTTTTTSFMNAPGAGGSAALSQQQQQPQVGSANPPLPPPPPAHVVAAVAAAAANLSGPIACDRSTNLKNQPAPSRTKQPTGADQDEGRAKNFL